MPETPPSMSSGGPRSSHGGSRSEEHRPPVQGPRSVSRLISRAARREQPFDISCNTKLICGNLWLFELARRVRYDNFVMRRCWWAV